MASSHQPTKANLEPMVNNVTPELMYLMHSNSDVTSLLSGTSIKATVSYISDYISKQTLKTHQIFSSAYDVFQKNSDCNRLLSYPIIAARISKINNEPAWS